MIAVAHRKDKIVVSRAVKILHGPLVFVKQIYDFLSVHAITEKMSASHIQIEVINLFVFVALLPKPFYNALFSIVDEEHYVR